MEVLHDCLGPPLARLETDVALTTLLARLPNQGLAALAARCDLP